MRLVEDGIPRRNRFDLFTPAEVAIHEAMIAVEAAGCHQLLTEAVVLLQQAHNKVADFVELPTEPEQIFAPWSTEQVGALNRYQRCGFVHPFTCMGGHDGSRDLIATRKGWICCNCDYVQNWAFATMLRAPVNPLDR